MRARAPASAANLGPGFDALGLALALYCEVSIEPAPRLAIVTEGEGPDITRDASHLAAAVAREVLGHDDVEIVVRSEIPVGRGLGSSAAGRAGSGSGGWSRRRCADCGRQAGRPRGDAAASFLGGLVAAATIEGSTVARRLPLDAGLCFVVVVPDKQLSTSEARNALPQEVPLRDAVHNLGRLGLLVAGLGDRASLVPEAGDDRLHQPARTPLFPESRQLMACLRSAGASVTTWSGAGPSILGICDGRRIAERVREAGEKELPELGLEGRSMVLDPDLEGLVVST